MRWPWSRRGVADSAVESPQPTAQSTTAAAAPGAAWASLPPLQRTFGTPELTTAPLDFTSRLAAWRSAAFTGVIQRHIDPAMHPIAGGLEGLSTTGSVAPSPTTPALLVAQSRGGRPSVPGASTDFTTQRYAASFTPAAAVEPPSVLTKAPSTGLPVVQLAAEPLPPELTPPPDASSSVPEGALHPSGGEDAEDAEPGGDRDDGQDVGEGLTAVEPFASQSSQEPAAPQDQAPADVMPHRGEGHAVSPELPAPHSDSRQLMLPVQRFAGAETPIPGRGAQTSSHGAPPTPPPTTTRTPTPAAALPPKRVGSAAAALQRIPDAGKPSPAGVGPTPPSLGPSEERAATASLAEEGAATAGHDPVDTGPHVPADGAPAGNPDLREAAAAEQGPAPESKDRLVEPDPPGVPHQPGLPVIQRAASSVAEPDVAAESSGVSDHFRDSAPRPSTVRLGLGAPLPTAPDSTRADAPVPLSVTRPPLPALPTVSRSVGEGRSDETIVDIPREPQPASTHSLPTSESTSEPGPDPASAPQPESQDGEPRAEHLGGDPESEGAVDASSSSELVQGGPVAPAPIAAPGDLPLPVAQRLTESATSADAQWDPPAHSGASASPHDRGGDVVFSATAAERADIERASVEPTVDVVHDRRVDSLNRSLTPPMSGPLSRLSLGVDDHPFRHRGLQRSTTSPPLRIHHAEVSPHVQPITPATTLTPLPLSELPVVPLQRLVDGSAQARPHGVQRLAAAPGDSGALTTRVASSVTSIDAPTPWSVSALRAELPPVGLPLGLPAPGPSVKPQGAEVLPIQRHTALSGASDFIVAQPSSAPQEPTPSTDQLSALTESVDQQAPSDVGGALPTAPTSPASASSAPAASASPAESSAQIDELARKLFDPLMLQLRAELLVDRERRGLRTDTW